ncbi:MAG TPA: endonuclease/exonuclease/phosphatase family protein [Kofleriaceae bacterium]|nr:endonuclease/exonuclease/phosphatase family protein [Kofleriaceae bacterium]
MLPHVAGRLSFLAILAILSLSSCVVVAPQGAARRSRQACRRPNLVVATYNVRFDTRKDREHRWSRRREQVGELLRSMQADLIGLQEVESNQLDDLQRMLPDYRHEGVGRDDGVRAGEFSPLFWNARRFQREDGGTFWLSPTPDRPRRGWQFKPWGSWHNRIATWALLRDSVTEKWLLVVNTHFDHYSELARRNSAGMLVRFIRQHTADHIIIMGDINARLRSEPLRILSTALDNTLLRARTVKRPRERTSVTVWTGLGAPGHHIDHVFVSPRLHPLSYEVVDRRLFYSGAERYPSDHLPVRVSLCEEGARR